MGRREASDMMWDEKGEVTIFRVVLVVVVAIVPGDSSAVARCPQRTSAQVSISEYK